LVGLGSPLILVVAVMAAVPGAMGRAVTIALTAAPRAGVTGVMAVLEAEATVVTAMPDAEIVAVVAVPEATCAGSVVVVFPSSIMGYCGL